MKHFVVAIGLILGVAACGDDGGPSGWQEEDIGAVQSLSGVWGTGPDNIFIVGGSDDQGEIHHYDGTEWSLMDVPSGVGLLVWSYGFGPSDIWSVGKGGAVLHYDGSAWSEVDSGTDQDLWGVWGAASNDVTIVGGNVFSGQVTILHWDGSTLEPEELPASENPLSVRALFKIYGIGGKVFAVGQQGLIVERTASGWVRHSAGTEADEDFVSLWGTGPDDLIAVGGRTTAIISTWDGSTWTTTKPPNNQGGLNAINIDENGEVLVGGVNGAVGVFNRETRAIDYEDSPATIDVHAIWSDEAGTSYGVGGTFFEPHRGIAMSRRTK